MKRSLPLLATTLLLFPQSQLQAHISSDGIIDTYSGLLHPFTEPAHLITILALGFMLTQQGNTCPPAGWGSFSIAAFIGLVASLMGLVLPVTMILLLLCIFFGVLVAAKSCMPLYICVGFSIIAGFIVGLDSTPAPEPLGILIVTVIGTTAGIGIALLAVIVISDACKQYWQQVAIRVAGSWIAASALLVFTLNLKMY